MPIKGKQRGRQFEQEVRNFLKERGWYIFPKGISTPGQDISAVKYDKFYLLEVKNLSKLLTISEANKIIKKINKEKEKLRYATSYKFKVFGGLLIKVKDNNGTKNTIYYLGDLITEKKGFVFKVYSSFYNFKSLEEWYNFVTSKFEFQDF